ncbi:MAG TPA: CvpA family protein [Burkholderiales bacterium]|nr:CvpA family protein [Burkholderiales bacterium]
MNLFDVALILLLTLFAALGVWRGLVRELVSLLTWAAAAIAAWAFADDAAALFKGASAEGPVRQTLGFIVIFISVYIAGTILGFVLHRFVSRSAGLRTANRAAGGVIGVVRGAAVIVLVFLLAGLTPFPQKTWWREAALAPVFEKIAVYATQYLPSDVARHVRYG